MKRKKTGYLLLFFALGGGLEAQSFLIEGEKELLKNNPKEAVVFLEAALTEKGVDKEKTLLYLGMAYDKLGQTDLAKTFLKQGADLRGPQQYLFWYNLGSLMGRLQDWTGASDSLEKALQLRPRHSPSVLNLANAKIGLSDWAGALGHYENYLLLDPDSPQKSSVVEMTGLLRGKIQRGEEDKKREEAQKLAEAARQERALEESKLRQEEEARLREEQRLASEKAAAEEAERQKLVLERIRNSLEGVGGDGQSLGVGAAGIQEVQEEFTLDD